MNGDNKITSSDIMAMPNGEALYALLDDMFPYFSSITFHQSNKNKSGWISVAVAKGSDSQDLVFDDLDVNFKHQFTYSVDGHGAYVEASISDITSLMTSWTRDNKLGQLGIK